MKSCMVVWCTGKYKPQVPSKINIMHALPIAILAAMRLMHSALKASLLSSSGGPLFRPRHVASSFVASDNKEVRHVIAQCT